MRLRLKPILHGLALTGLVAGASYRLWLVYDSGKARDPASGHTEAIRLVPQMGGSPDYITPDQMLLFSILCAMVVVCGGAFLVLTWLERRPSTPSE